MRQFFKIEMLIQKYRMISIKREGYMLPRINISLVFKTKKLVLISLTVITLIENYLTRPRRCNWQLTIELSSNFDVSE